MSSPSAFERRGGPQGATGPTGPGGPTGATGPPSPAITLSGNTTGTLTLVSTGTLTLAGGANITLSQSGNHVTISGAAGAGATAISGIANSQTTYTSGTVSLSELGAITVRSTTGNQFQLSVNSQTVQTQNAVDLTLSGNTSGALALVSSGTATLAGGANITLSQAGNAITISGAAGGAFSAGMSTEGNTAGNTGVTGSRLVLVGSNNISLSQTTGAAGATLSINGPASSSLSATGVASISVNGSTISIGVASTAPQTGISGVANSQTTYTSGTVSLSELGAITIRSTTGNQYQLSVNSQTVQTQNLVDVTLAGNSTSAGGGYALISSGTMTLAGGANVTLSQNGNAVTVSAGGGAETQTFIGGISASDTVYTSGTVKFTGVGGGITVSSNTGQRVDLSVAAQTNQAGSVYASSNTFGTSSGTYDARSLSIAGRGAVSVAASNSGWIISAPTQTTQVETQTFVGGVANSETTYTSGTVSLSELGAITIRSTTGNQYQLSVNAQTNQAGSVYASSNTFGTSSGTYDARSLSIAGRGAVSVAASNSGWIISAPTQTTQVETQTFVGGISASDTNYTSGTVRFTGSNMITVKSSGAGQTIILDATQSVQTQNVVDVTLAGNSTSAGGGYALISSGTMTLAGGNNITLSQNANAVTISAAGGPETQTAISGIVASNATYTSGTVTFTGVGGGVTVSSNTGQRVDISVAAPVAQTNQAGSVYASSNTFGTSSGTYDARTLSIAGAGAVSVAASNSGFVISVPAVVAQTNQSGNVYASSNTFGTSSGTYDARSISIAGSGAVGVAASNSGFVISAPSQTNQAGSVYAISNTSGTSSGTYDARTLSIAGAGIVTVAASNSGWRIDANQTGNVYASSNTTGTSSGTYDARSISIAGAGAASVAASNSGWVISAPASSSLSATGAVSISVNGSTISIGAPAASMSYYDQADLLQFGVTQGIGASAATRTTVTAWVQPISFGADLAFNNINLAASISMSTNSTSISSQNWSFSMGASLGFYSLNVSTMSLVTSFSGSLGYTNASAAAAGNLSATARVGMGGSSTTKSTQGAANLSAIFSSITGARKIPLMWSTQNATLTEGQYWAVGCFTALTSSIANASITSVGFVSNRSVMGSAFNPPEMMKDTASVTSPYPFLGLATLVNSSNSLMPVSFETSVITTATAIANSTNFQSLWMQIHRSHSN